MTHLDTLAKWREHKAEMTDYRSGYFEDYPLYAMRRSYDGRYQFGYEIVGHGTVVGHCCHHAHKSRTKAEKCGRRFLSGQPPRWWWRVRRVFSAP
ncbi:hypothetical protein [Mycolicibacterium llatzerense]|uniref:hypothetical protein n=1 Tax=Mycolicibacterium llatzerense TaxID=280871 RepID=UPI0021B4DB01|nr:hypothetical protein [Mycolicibacterium llatzerense]MCT7369445.1 hypothetical protein [Mycolicibacterium llatzerense]